MGRILTAVTLVWNARDLVDVFRDEETAKRAAERTALAGYPRGTEAHWHGTPPHERDIVGDTYVCVTYQGECENTMISMNDKLLLP